MATSLSDSFILGANVTFQNRVQSALVGACIAISTEGLAVPNHGGRLQLVHQVLSSPGAQASYAEMFALSIATDGAVLADATVGGTVVLTPGNIVAQEALVTDAHIAVAISGQFNAYCQQIPA